jgi:hypothetical protein
MSPDPKETAADAATRAAEETSNRFRSALDQHGFGFQYAVLQKLVSFFDDKPLWTFEVAEFPVTTGRFDTRLDFVLRDRNRRFFIACECKRANPAMNHWCFARAPFVRRGKTGERLIVDEVEVQYLNSSSDPFRARLYGNDIEPLDSVYHLGIEIRNPKEKGDQHSNRSGYGAIEDAVTQVCKGVNGLAAALADLAKPNPSETITRHGRDFVVSQIMPAIFTTAQLWTTETDLGATDLASGNLNEKDFRSLELVSKPT